MNKTFTVTGEQPQRRNEKRDNINQQKSVRKRQQRQHNERFQVSQHMVRENTFTTTHQPGSSLEISQQRDQPKTNYVNTTRVEASAAKEGTTKQNKKTYRNALGLRFMRRSLMSSSLMNTSFASSKMKLSTSPAVAAHPMVFRRRLVISLVPSKPDASMPS